MRLPDPILQTGGSPGMVVIPTALPGPATLMDMCREAMFACISAFRNHHSFQTLFLWGRPPFDGIRNETATDVLPEVAERCHDQF